MIVIVLPHMHTYILEVTRYTTYRILVFAEGAVESLGLIQPRPVVTTPHYVWMVMIVAARKHFLISVTKTKEWKLLEVGGLLHIINIQVKRVLSF